VVSTASTDFGPAALVDRFGQIEPTVLLTATSSRYGGKEISHVESIEQIVGMLPTVTKVVVIGTSDTHTAWDDWLAPHRGSELTPTSLPFNHPGFILFSSGTTGRPKCIVHSAAGVLLKVLSEQGYHLDVRAGARVRLTGVAEGPVHEVPGQPGPEGQRPEDDGEREPERARGHRADVTSPGGGRRATPEG
jgi:acetoacetyl-CoA synthetase